MENNYQKNTEEDRYRGKQGRKAAEKGNDSEFLDGSGLEDDLVDNDTSGNEGQIVRSDDPDSQEWNAREDTNKDPQ